MLKLTSPGVWGTPFQSSNEPNYKNQNFKVEYSIQGRITQLVAYRLDTGEVLGSNPGKGENF